MDSTEPAAWSGEVSARFAHKYAVLDVETTGLSARRHRVVQVAITQLDRFGVIEQEWSTLVDPGVATGADVGAVDVHGLTAQALAGAPSYAAIASTVADQVRGRVVVAHNAAFDWAFLAAEGARVDLPLPTRQRLCTIELTRQPGTPVPTYSLESLCGYWQVRQARPHDATDDVRVLVEVLRHALTDAAGQGTSLPIRDPYARRPLRKRIRRRYRRLRWKLRRARDKRGSA